jgi:hypothetical protein
MTGVIVRSRADPATRNHPVTPFKAPAQNLGQSIAIITQKRGPTELQTTD